MAVLKSTTQPASSQATAPPSLALTLPPAHLFDILPALHEILARVEHVSPDITILHADTADDDEMGANYTNLQRLEPKELSTAVLPLKAQMRRGLRELERLADMERSVEEQGKEIAELEARIRKQEEVMRGMEKMGEAVRARLGS